MAKKPRTIKMKNVNKGAGRTRFSQERYNATKKVIVATVPRIRGGIPTNGLPKMVARRLPADLLPAEGSASWYTTVVKLDLDARGLIERIPGQVPQRLRRIK